MNKEPGNKKTKLGWIPKEWEIIRIGKLGEVLTGLTYSPSDVKDNGTLVLRSSNIQDGKISYEDNVRVDTSDLKFEKVKLDDILICVRNGSRSLIGKNAIIKEEDTDVAFGAFMSVYRSNENPFLYYLFESKFFKKEVHRNLGATINSINKSTLRKFQVPYPPKKERIKIQSILSTWDEAIQKTEALIQKKEQLKKGLMQQLLTGKTRFDGFEGEWEEVRFKDVAKIDAESLSSKTLPNYEFEYISLSDIENGEISEKLDIHEFKNAPSRAKRIVSEGDILMATVRPNLQAFALARKEHQGKIASTGFAVLTSKNDFNIKYLYHYLYSHHISSQFYALIVGSNYPAINSSDVKKLKIRIPKDHEEINKIELVLTNIDNEIKGLEKNKQLLVSQKKGLMQQLLTGKTRVSVN